MLGFHVECDSRGRPRKESPSTRFHDQPIQRAHNTLPDFGSHMPSRGSPEGRLLE